MKRHVIEGKEIQEEQLLSEGAYGYIYKARDVRSGQLYALKKMLCQGQERIQVAQNEIAIFKQLPNHRNLVNYYGSQVNKNEQGVYQALILMEFCPGGSLFDMMAKNPNARFPESQILSIANEVTQGLKAMHSLNPPMAHRDIKIENILYSDRLCKLCDFGSCSRQRVDFSKIDKTEFYSYEEDYEKNTTLMYRPPEMADLYQRYEVNEKVDVWMLGCVLFTICFFIHPFQESQKLAIVNATYQIPKSSTYSEKLHDLIRLMLTPNPKLRPSIFEIEKLLMSFNSLHSIPLNKPQAQEIKNREKVLEKEMEQYEKNASKIKKFDGDIPMEELMKLQQKIKSEQSNPSTQKAPPQKPQQSYIQAQQKNKKPITNQQNVQSAGFNAGFPGFGATAQQPQSNQQLEGFAPSNQATQSQTTSQNFFDAFSGSTTPNPIQHSFSSNQGASSPWGDFSQPKLNTFDSWDGGFGANQQKPQQQQQPQQQTNQSGWDAWGQPPQQPQATNSWSQPFSQPVAPQQSNQVQPQAQGWAQGWNPGQQQPQQNQQQSVSNQNGQQVQEFNLIDLPTTTNQSGRIDLTNLIL